MSCGHDVAAVVLDADWCTLESEHVVQAQEDRDMPAEARPADELDCTNPKLAQARTATLRVRDVMVASPKTMQATVTVADVRQAFANPHVRSALLVDGSRFAGVINRAALPEAAAGTDSARDYTSVHVATVSPDKSRTGFGQPSSAHT